MSTVFVEAVGVAAPGLADWRSAVPILQGEAPYVPGPLVERPSQLLPGNERRRATASVRLAFQAAEDAISTSFTSAGQLASVFASSDADLNIIHRICSALPTEQRLVSPTDFHNSVHNAAAGYWSIAVGARTPSTTVSGYDDSFTVGLIEAIGLVVVEAVDVLLVAFDRPAPEPLHAKRPIEHPMGVALVLTRERNERSLAVLECKPSSEAATSMSDPVLEAFRRGTPAGRALPLLEALARRESRRIVLAAEGGLGQSVQSHPL